MIQIHLSKMGGSLTELEIIKILSKYPTVKPKIFIETGTYKGETARIASRIFETVHTIEIKRELYEEAQRLNRGITNINYYLGDSLKILPEISRSETTFYFLDAHQSGIDTTNNGMNVPLLEELKGINNSSIIVIDDVRLFDAYWDWKGITPETILKVIKENCEVKDYYIENDRMIVFV